MDDGQEFHDLCQVITNDHYQVKELKVSSRFTQVLEEGVQEIKQEIQNFKSETTSTQNQQYLQPLQNWEVIQPQQPQQVENQKYQNNDDDQVDNKQPNDDKNNKNPGKDLLTDNPFIISFPLVNIQPIFPGKLPNFSIITKGFISQQTYSYQDYELLDQILKSTQMQYFTIHKEYKVIEYNFDRKQFIKLNDLIYWILEGLVLIHVGQLLDLFQNILEYIRLLELKNIHHEYLDSNRIWLFMDENSKFPSVVPEIMNYRIILTGYQCPFYEDYSQQQMKASDKIVEILIGIIFSLKSKNFWLVTNDDKIEKVKSIYQKFLNAQMTNKSQFSFNFSLAQFIQLIIDTKQKYHYNKETQMLNFDLNSDYLQFRISKSFLLAQEIKNLFTQFNGQNQLFLENAFQESVPLYGKYLVNNQLPKIETKLLDQFKQKLAEKYKLLQEQIYGLISQEVKKEIENYKKLFKFDFTEEDIQEINKDILIEYDKAKIKNYFMNSIQFYNKDMNKKKIILFEGIALDLIQKRIKLSLENTMFKFDIELI